MAKEIEIYYQDPRLKMTAVGRFFVRLISYFSYGFLLAGAVVGIISDVAWLQSFGALVMLFIIERLYHLGKPERPLSRLSAAHANARMYLDPAAYAAIEGAYDQVAVAGGDIELRLLSELLKRREIKKAMLRMDVGSADLIAKIDGYLQESGKQRVAKDALAEQLEKIVLSALIKARGSFSASIEPKDILSALSEVGGVRIKRLFALFDINTGDLDAALLFSKKTPFTLTGFLGKPLHQRHRVMNRAWTARPTPILDEYSTDITDLVRAGEAGFLIGHEQEYERLVSVLSRPGNPNALLIGEPGAGKESLITHLAFQIIKDRVPSPLFDKRLVMLDIGSLVAGAHEGDVQERLNAVLEEIVAAGNIILYVPDMHNLVKTSGEMRMSAADIFLPAIRSSLFSVVGTTLPREYKQFIEPNSSFKGAFEEVRVQEVSEAQATQYLVYQGMLLEQKTKVVITFSAIKEAVRLSHKYFRDKLLPGSAEDLLKETLADAMQKGKSLIKGDDVVAVAEQKINIPLHTVGAGEAKQLLKLEETIHKSFIDQDEAVKAVSSALREYRSGLSRKGGPIATFLFVGPTGVGKTELSKIIAKIQFGSKDLMTRFDMSQYQTKESIVSFIGSSDGSVSGALADAVLERPYSLILLDEFEKAHPDILNLFLAIFDDGKMNDSVGRAVDFTNTIIIATSNAHSGLIKEEIEKGTSISTISDLLKKRLVEYFKPELLNRFSDIIVFKSLSRADTIEIAKLNLEEVISAMQQAQAVDLSFDATAVQKIAELGYDPVFGARPLRKVISEQIRGVLAEQVLKGEIPRGCTLTVSHNGHSFVFEQSEK